MRPPRAARAIAQDASVGWGEHGALRYEPSPGTIPTLHVPDPRPWRRLHLIGIGGAGMRGIARLLMARGIAVSGSDLKESPGLEALRRGGATVFVGHRAAQVGRPDAVVISSAIPADNVEVRQARQAGIEVLMRAQVLAALMRGTRAVAIAGTHGKTTTTSMISVMLAATGLDPTFLIGGDLNESGSGAGHGEGDVFVAEADESDGSFLLLHPEIGVVTNVEADHLDFYRNPQEVEAAFAAFCRQARTAVACGDDGGARRALFGAGANVVRYGRGDDAQVRLLDERVGPSSSEARVEAFGESVGLRLSVPGRHNLLNAAGALCVAHLLGVPLPEAAEGLRHFAGVRRRFERRGTVAGAAFVDDYAHHPTEIAATLEAAERNGHRIVAVFQPHRYTRTQAMWRPLGESLRAADVVVLTDVYGAGEQPIPGVTGKLLLEALTEASPGKRVVYLPRRSDVAPFLAGLVREGDLVLTLGAGDITMVGEETLRRMREVAG